MIFLSLKTYKESTGNAVINLLSSVGKVSRESGITILPVAQPTDIYRIKKELGIEVWAQHMDPIDPGRNMGWLSPYALKDAGATGVVINHSEHEVDKETIGKTLAKAKEYGLKTLLIGHSIEDVIEFDSLGADYVSYERADMIGGGVSMLTQEEEGVKKLVSVLRNPLIIGAGVATGKDIKQAVALGAKGAILASAFVLSKNPEETLCELVSGFTNE